MMEVKENVFTDKQEKIARYSKALGHPVRVFIMDFLVKNTEKCCYSGDMALELPIARSTLSQHLSELKAAGLIQSARATTMSLVVKLVNDEDLRSPRARAVRGD